MQKQDDSAIPGAAASPGRSRVRSNQQPVRRTGATMIYDALFQSIAVMELLPGEPLQEKTLTQRFGVSRTPVREALLHLARDGLVDLLPQSGTFVGRIPIGAIHEAAVIRRALEEITVSRLAEIAGPADIARLDMVLARQRLSAQIGDTDGFHEADEAFHEMLALMAGYTTIWQVVRQTKVQMDRVRRLTLPDAGRMDLVVEEHRQIRDAIAAKDAEAAKAALDYHLSVIVPDVGRLSLLYPDYFIGGIEEFNSFGPDGAGGSAGEQGTGTKPA